MANFEDIGKDLIEQESNILDREMRSFLAKHNLPLDREKIKEAGFEIVTEHIMPPDPLGETKYIFKLCKIVDQHKIKITHSLNIVEKDNGDIHGRAGGKIEIE